jgi:hypothetical protein
VRAASALLLVAGVGAGLSAGSWRVAGLLSERDPRSRAITREIPWDGSEALVVGAPADVRFIQAPGPGKVVVTGRPRSVDTFRVAGGVLDDRTLRTGERLQIVVTAPKVTRFSLKGTDTLGIEGFDQDELRIEATGRAKVKAAGRTRTVHLALQGSGAADLSQVEAAGAEVALSASRLAVVAPRSWAKASGRGVVVLVSRPDAVESDMAGDGQVIRAAPPGPAF